MSPPISVQPPADWDDFPDHPNHRKRFREAWSRQVDDWTNGEQANFYNPSKTDVGDAQPAAVQWNSFPMFLEDCNDQRKAWAKADERLGGAQGEYSEWSVARDGDGKVARVTFTAELAEYWQALWDVDPDRVAQLYSSLLDARISRSDLEKGGSYDPLNRWNLTGAVHMIVGINTLPAAIGVVRSAATQNPSGVQARRQRAASQAEPTEEGCSGGGFHADPLIQASVQRLVARKLWVSLSDPVGLYLGTPQFNRFELPANAGRNVHPRDFWTIVRGRRERTLRAVYEVPASHGFTVGDIKIDGQPIQYGAQVARTLESGSYVTPILKPKEEGQ